MPGVVNDRGVSFPVAGVAIGDGTSFGDAVPSPAPLVATTMPLPWESGEEVRNNFRRMIPTLIQARNDALAVGVCSTAEGEGTSWIVAGLACALRGATDDVWIVDAQRSRPSQVELFRAMAPSLAGSSLLPAAREGESLAPIFLVDLTRGAGADDARVLASTITSLRRPGRVVLVDLEPLRESPQALGLARVLDGVLVVAEAERERREVIRRSVESLKRTGHRVLGAVLNKRVRRVPQTVYHWL